MFENFKRVTSGLDVAPLLAALDSHPALWKETTARQSFPNSPHKDTESIILRWSSDHSMEAAFADTSAVDHPAYAKLPEAVSLVNALIAKAGGRDVGRIILAKLEPHGIIDPHVDEGAYSDTYERFHIVLTSADGNVFLVGQPNEYGEFIHMKPGEAWWFNHKRPHWAVNGSDEPRIHLIVDMVAPLFRKEREIVATNAAVKREVYA